jgi:hypothetical protein
VGSWSEISALFKNSNCLYSAKTTIFNLFVEGFSILFKATYQNPHTMETFPLTGASKKRELQTRLSQTKSFHCSLGFVLWGSLT